MVDINLHSFNGPHDNGRTVDWTDRDIVPGPEIADTIKCSTGLSGFVGRFRLVVAGYEDALDVNNHCRFLDISAKRWVFNNKHKMGFTVKGNSHSVRISGVVHGDPLVDLGNASDQSTEWVTGVKLNLTRGDIPGAPIRVRVLQSSYPIEEPGSGPYRYIFPSNIRWSPLRRFLMKCFMEFRRLQKRFS
jgi:hypothetical protein